MTDTPATPVTVFESVEKLQHEAARMIAGLLAPSAEGQTVSIALSGGSTPRRMHEILAAMPGINWSNVQVFWGDERTVPPDHDQSNYRMAMETLLQPAGVPQENIHRMEGELEPEDAARRYEEHLRTLPESNGLPVLDIVLLGMGADGHTASLFPGTGALTENKRLATANEVPALETTRITLTYPVLNNARTVIFLVAGADKAPKVVESLAGTTPAGLVKPLNGTLHWLLDAPAAAELEE